jgi:hypothetical protein
MNKSVHFLLFALFLSFTIHAQEGSKKSTADLPYFVDADVGALIVLDYSASGYAHAALGAGYRFHPYHGAGLEYRRGYFSNSYDEDISNALGASYRFTYRGLFAKVSLGLIVDSKRYTDEYHTRYNSTGGGHYQNLTLGYRFRSGILIGASLAGYINRNFDREQFVFDVEPEYPYDRIEDIPPDAGSMEPAGQFTESFGTLTLTLGYAFPGRGRR